MRTNPRPFKVKKEARYTTEEAISLRDEIGEDRDAYRQWYYEVYLWCDHWVALREEAFKTYGKRCCYCRRRKPFHVHHLHYRKLFDVRIGDVCVLCRVCHHACHGSKLMAQVIEDERRVKTSRGWMSQEEIDDDLEAVADILGAL